MQHLLQAKICASLRNYYSVNIKRFYYAFRYIKTPFLHVSLQPKKVYLACFGLFWVPVGG
jgi:hypothetical protein